MKLAVYGGSFNPPHAGHVRLAHAAADFLQPDLFLIVPDHQPPHKTLAANSPSPEARLELCRIAFRSVPSAVVSDLELRRVGRSYTSDTVKELRQEVPEGELFLVIGSDMLFSFTEWHEYRYILSQCTLAVAARLNGETEALARAVQRLREEEQAKILLLTYEPYPASSTEIRKALAEGRCPAGLDEEVYQCIRENGYYLESPMAVKS